MEKNIYLIGGSKGGVGKSMVTMAMVDYFQQKGEEILLIESDTSNPDVWKCYNHETKCELLNLDHAEGWINLVNLCEQNKDRIVIINTAARNTDGVARHGAILNSSLTELKRKLVTLWVINRQRDGLELLRKFMTAVPDAEVHVIRNGYFGHEDKFELYNTSKVRETIESRGGKSLNFPELADRVSDDLYSKRLSIAKASKELPIGNRAELFRWRAECHRMIEEAGI